MSPPFILYKFAGIEKMDNNKMDKHKVAFNVIVISFLAFVHTFAKRKNSLIAKRNTSLDCWLLLSRVKWISKHSSWEWMMKLILDCEFLFFRSKWNLLSSFHSSNKNIFFFFFDNKILFTWPIYLEKPDHGRSGRFKLVAFASHLWNIQMSFYRIIIYLRFMVNFLHLNPISVRQS